MLRVGLSGGIGSGKSTVAQRLLDHGAVLVDSDVLAREVVRPGSPGLAEIVECFGDEVLDDEGALDRPAMARRVFGDEAARTELNSIVHPRVRHRTAELVAAAPADAIVVQDIPLLVESGYGPWFHLVLIVGAPVDERVRRLVERGLDEDDARARIRAQATDEQRRAAADVWLDNSGPVAHLLSEVDTLWSERLVPFEANVRQRSPPECSPGPLAYRPGWPVEAARLITRVEAAAGERALRVDHVGSTSVPGLDARDVIDLQVAVRSMIDADALAEPFADAGFPVLAQTGLDTERPGARREQRRHAAADPGRHANLHLRVAGSHGWRAALLLRDWLRVDAAERADYARTKRAAVEQADGIHDGYAEAKESWLTRALPRAEAWAERTGWTPPDVE